MHVVKGLLVNHSSVTGSGQTPAPSSGFKNQAKTLLRSKPCSAVG